MKFIILTALAVMAVRGQMMYPSLLPTQYPKSMGLGAYPVNYPLNFRPYPVNYPLKFPPYPVNYPMNFHQYPMQVAQIPMQVPQTQDFPLINYPLNFHQYPMQEAQIPVQAPQIILGKKDALKNVTNSL